MIGKYHEHKRKEKRTKKNICMTSEWKERRKRKGDILTPPSLWQMSAPSAHQKLRTVKELEIESRKNKRIKHIKSRKNQENKTHPS